MLEISKPTVLIPKIINNLKGKNVIVPFKIPIILNKQSLIELRKNEIIFSNKGEKTTDITHYIKQDGSPDVDLESDVAENDD